MQPAQNDRRRRVVLGEAVQTASDSVSVPSECVSPSDSADHPSDAKRNTSSYSRSIRRRHQIRLTDLIPKRRLTVTAWIALMLSAVAGLTLLDQSASSWKPAIGDAGVAALSIESPNSLAAWFNNAMLILAAASCVQIYLLRRHRSDDYRGQYRMWLWLGLLMIVGSVNCIVGVLDIGILAIRHWLMPNQPFTVGSGWNWVKFGALAMVAGRFAYEMRQSRGAIIGCALASAAYTTALFAPSMMAWFSLSSLVSSLPFNSAVLIAKVAVVATMMIYARFIYLDAHGLIRKKSANSQRRAAQSNSSKTSGRKSDRDANALSALTSKNDTSKKTTVRRRGSTSAGSSKDTNLTGSSKKRRTQKTAEPSKQASAKRASAKPSNGNDAAKSDDSNHAGKSSQNSSRSRQQTMASEVEQLDDGRPLSKSERRRLKKLQRRQNRAA